MVLLLIGLGIGFLAGWRFSMWLEQFDPKEDPCVPAFMRRR